MRILAIETSCDDTAISIIEVIKQGSKTKFKIVIMLITLRSITFIYIRGNFEQKVELSEQVIGNDFDDIC